DESEDEVAADEAAPEADYVQAPGPAEAAADRDVDGGDTADWADDGGGSVETRGDEDFEPQNVTPESLQQHLLWQLNLAGFNPRQTAIATVLIDALNADGYLADGIEAVRAALPTNLAADLDEIEAVRRRLQGFDPLGVASLDLRDCLRSQLEQFDAATPQRELALAIVDGELELLARNDIGKLARKLRASEDEVAAAAALIRSLDPRPGAALDTTPVEYVAPDVYAVKDGGRWQVRLNPDAQP